MCQLPRNALLRYGRDFLKLDDWSTKISEIKTTESKCGAISNIVNTERVDAALKEQQSRMDELFDSQKEHYQSLEQTAGQIAADLRQGFEEQRDWHRTEEESQCLQALCTSTYVDHKDIKPDRVPGTCRWFLDNNKFHEWAESETSELLWVTADPGCGKSALSRSLVDGELRSTLSLTTAYYFFKDDSPEQRSVTHALCALVHQICSQNRALLQKAVNAYQTNGGTLTLSFVWMWRLLLEISQHPEAGEIVCIVDALDECQANDDKTLISALNDLQASQQNLQGQIKFLVTSRPYYNIEESFDPSTIRLAGEDENQAIKHEIDLVIKDRVSKIASRKKLDHETQAALQDRLLQTENRTYLWLHLTLDGIENGFDLATPKKMKAFIDQLPRTVHQAYEAMLLRCPQPEQARKLLHIVLAAVRPLTLSEMNMVFHVERGQKSHEEVDLYPRESFGKYVKNLCGLLVRVFDSKVFFLHQTVRGFLMTPEVDKHIDSGAVWEHSMEPKESNLILGSRCLYYLLFTVFDDTLDTTCYRKAEHDVKCKQIFATEIDHLYSKGEDFRLFRYAASHWYGHFKTAREDPELIEMWDCICDTATRRFIRSAGCTEWICDQIISKKILEHLSRLTARRLREENGEVEFRDWEGLGRKVTIPHSLSQTL